MLRITAIGAGAVDYLLKGCDDPGHSHAEIADRADAGEMGADRYFARAMEAGEPAGRWFGSGWQALGIDVEVGGEASAEAVRAMFGQLRRPESTERDPRWIGSKPKSYGAHADRLEKLRAAEPDASPERLREMEREAAAGGNRAVAYYDLTFSPVKSVSILYAAYLATGQSELAGAVREAHDEAVRIALAYAEQHCSMTRFGRTEQGRVYAETEGFAAVLFAHHTSREGEPQLHTHAGVLNRVATAEGRVGALDGKAFRPVKEAIAAAYERAVEQLVTEATGLGFELRPDGIAREVIGMDPDLMASASTRRGQVLERVSELVETYRQTHGREPGAEARKAMAQTATLDTRAAKSGLAGPSAVAAWADGHRDRLATVVEECELATVATMANGQPDMATRERLVAAMTAGLGDVQAAYATWQLGNLADAIDRHLGDAGALGVPARERAAFVEDLAREVIDPSAGYGVVTLNTREPADVPAGLRRADGAPIWRPREERRFATVEHVSVERGLVATAQAATSRTLDLEAAGPVLERAGLSADQGAAVRGIATSGRRVDVLVGPAGTGKSRTVSSLAAAWAAQSGGTVFGVATSQIATSNLNHDGLTALNLTRFLAAVRPDPVTGHVRTPLSDRDLIVVDEATMATTGDLAAVADAAAKAGAKVVVVGDPAQLDAVGAGGLFSHLAENLPSEQVHHLDQAHRFTNGWEADASLGLRNGDRDAVQAYADHGRLITGTVEEMTAAARRGWLTDRLNNLDAALLVGSNETAAALSGDLRAELVELGRVDGDELFELADHNVIGIGDIIETRRNAWSLRVDPSPDGTVEAVMNRGRFTVLGWGEDGTILGRDRNGGVAHLPQEYLAEHAGLGYAITDHGGQGITVDVAHGLVDRDATREAAYVKASRGRDANYLYVVTEREPDAHEPQRIAEEAVERLMAVMELSRAQRAAVTVDAADLDASTHAATLVSRLEHAGREGARVHLGRVSEQLGSELDPDDYATEKLLAALRSVELDGHDPAALLDHALDSRGFDDVDSVASVLAHRVRGAAAAVEREPAGIDWTDRAGVGGREDLDVYARDVTARIRDRQTELAQRVADEGPAWAVTLGDRPDPDLDPAAEQAWRQRAGVTAFYREAAGVDPQQVSLGAPPALDRPVEAVLYDAALEAAVEPEAAPRGRDWRRAADADLYAAREAWMRQNEQAPAWVAEELADTHTLARGYLEDATIDRARAAALPDSEARAQIAEDAERAARFAEHHAARATELEAAHEARASWWAAPTAQRDADAAAARELERRGLPEQRTPDPEPEVHPVVPPAGPEPDTANPVTQPEPVIEEPAVELSPAATARAAELEQLEQAGREAVPEPELALEVKIEPEMGLDELAQERAKLLDPQLEAAQTELEMDDGLEMEDW